MGGEGYDKVLDDDNDGQVVRKREGWEHFECILKVGPTRSLAVWLSTVMGKVTCDSKVWPKD